MHARTHTHKFKIRNSFHKKDPLDYRDQSAGVTSRRGQSRREVVARAGQGSNAACCDGGLKAPAQTGGSDVVQTAVHGRNFKLTPQGLE